MSSSPRFFETAAAFGEWLAKNADKAEALVVGFRKVGSGQPSLSWPESVDEALCVGWIDGVRKRIDDDSYQIRFTPRRAGSIWSSVNIAKVAKLVELGRMQPAGLEAFARRTEKKSSIYSYEQAGTPELAPDEIQAFKADRKAWRYFEATPPGYRKQMVSWVVGAKQAATRARRLARFIEACAEARRLDRLLQPDRGDAMSSIASVRARVSTLMSVRDGIVGRFGLKTAAGLQCVTDRRIGIFKVYRTTPVLHRAQPDSGDRGSTLVVAAPVVARPAPGGRGRRPAITDRHDGTRRGGVRAPGMSSEGRSLQ